MPVQVYRLIKQRVSDTPLSAEGARRLGGRSNPHGIGILYTSASPELALLEQLVHLRSLPYSDLPKLLLLTLNLPEPPRLISPQELPLTWRDESDYSANHQFLIDWLTRPDVFAVGISSAVVAESVNYLLHPQHPSFERVKVTRSSAFSIDPRLWVASTG